MIAITIVSVIYAYANICRVIFCTTLLYIIISLANASVYACL